jgi:transposase-like protein
MKGEQDKPSNEELKRENARLKRENAALKERVHELEREGERLREMIEQLQRAQARQAAPHRRDAKNRKSSGGASGGRKDGHRPAWRQKPTEEEVDRVREEPLECCPHCGGPVTDKRKRVQFLHELPRDVQIETIKLISYTACCESCGPVESTCEGQLSRAGGCARTQAGPRALAFAARLKFALGMTYRKVCEVLDFFGLTITPGGLVQAFHRMARKLIGVWLQIWKRIRAGPLVHVDETSWYVGAPGWWLWVFANGECTLYTVESTRGSAVVERLLVGNSDQVLISDCLSTYDPIERPKQKCLAHHKKALRNAIERLPDAVTEPLREIKLALTAALALGNAREDIEPDRFARHYVNLQEAVDSILERDYEHEGVGKALHRFRNHRDSLFTFLERPEVPPTNNHAERQLRGPVIARKLSCGNRTKKGKGTWQVLTSIAATCRQQARSFVDLVAQALPLNASTPQLFQTTG